jgi:hypothetical protein
VTNNACVDAAVVDSLLILFDSPDDDKPKNYSERLASLSISVYCSA